MSHNANDIRRLAEEADGTRGKTLYLTIKKGKLEIEERKPVKGTIATIRTQWSEGGLRGTARLEVANVVIPPSADAVFSTQSAVEKFAIPYYSRSMTPAALGRKVKKLFAKKNVVAFHLPGSDIDGTGTKRGPGLYAADESGKVTFIV